MYVSHSPYIYNITGMQPQVEKSLLLQLILPETARTFQTPRHGRRATSCPGATGKTRSFSASHGGINGCND